MDFIDAVILLLLLAVLGTLIAGLINMGIGKNPRRSNQLMMSRVILQAAAVLLTALFLAKNS